MVVANGVSTRGAVGKLPAWCWDLNTYGGYSTYPRVLDTGRALSGPPLGFVR